MAQSTNVDQALRYLQDAADLRVALQYNLLDGEFAQKGGRIVYLVDANVVRLFLSPSAEDVAPFTGDQGKHLEKTAIVTAEYLFSRQLPGQEGTPVLIAPGHGDDLGYIIGALREETESAADKDGPIQPELSESDRSQLRELFARLRDGSGNWDDAYRALRAHFPGLEVHLGTFGLTKQLHRLYKEDLLRPLAIHSRATSDVLEPNLSEIRFWTERLTRGRRMADQRGARRLAENSTNQPIRLRRDERESSTIRHRKDERDAAAIVQTEMLNRMAIEDGSRLRYVLVTGDKVVRRTYATWFWSPENSHQELERYSLRQPIQFLPILNMADMPNRVSETLIYTTQSVLDTLLSNIRSIDARYPYTLSYHSARIFEKRKGASERDEIVPLFFGIDPYQVEMIEPGIMGALRTAWRKSFYAGEVQNAVLLRRRAEAEFAPLTELFDREPDLRLAILREQERLLLEVEAAHLSMGTNMNLRALTRLGERATRGPGRGPFSIRVDFTNIVGIEGGIGPAEVLDALVRDHAQLARISRRLQQPGDYEAMFFGACVAFRCAQWHAARQHIYRALSFLPAGVESGNLRQEMRHLLAVAIRFSMCKAAEFSEANTILEEEADYFSNRSDPLGHARALSERATLHGWAIQKAAMLPRSSIPSVRPIFSHDFSLIARQLKLAAEDPRCKKGGAWYGAWSIVNLQFAANLIGSEILRQYFVPKVPAVSSDLLDTAVATVEKQLRGGAFPKVLGLGVRMLRWGAMTDHKVRAAEGEAIRQECERITADPTVGELADLDRAELEEFARIVGGSPSAKAS